MFNTLLDRIKTEVVAILLRVQVRAESDVDAVEAQHQQATDVEYHHDEATALTDVSENDPSEQADASEQPYVRDGRKVGRNEPLPPWFRQEIQAVSR